jgi:perosamine synthetase
MNDVKEFASPRSGRLTLGTYGEEFERRFADYRGAKHAVAVNSGTSALEIIFRALGVDDVLVPANANYATVAAVVHAGGRPVLMDTEAETLGTAPEEVERCITPNTAGFPWLLPNSPAQPSLW